MKYLIKILFFSLQIAIFGLGLTLKAEIKLPKLISDGMVLQRDTEVRIWGWAAPGELVSIDFNDKNYSAVTDSSGNWEIMMNNLRVGGPYNMTIAGENTLLIKNILVGDVWICSGQSNMELPMKRVAPLYEKEIETANNPKIRYLKVPHKYDFKLPQNDIESGNWQEVNQENIAEFSAVAYFFGEKLFSLYKVPIGLINTSLGGSPAQAWMSEDALKKYPHYYEDLQIFKNDELIEEIELSDGENWKNWHAELFQKDKGNKDHSWISDDLDISNWNEMEIPGYWVDEDLGDKHGVVYFRKDLNVPKSMLGKEIELVLGRIVDADSVYVNGTFVGTTGYKYPPRWYKIPVGVLREGKNNITIRVINESGHGGFYLDKPYELKCAEANKDLKGMWKYKLGAEMPPKEGQTFIRWKPSGLYNAMISPLLKFKMKGVIWYQGESNVKNALEYGSLFPDLIQNWRENFKQGDFPFLYVQLANYLENQDQPSESAWALLRDAQLNTLSLPNTAMAVSIDIGEWNDVHPLNKKDVGERLALASRKLAYGEEAITFSGPIYESMEIKDAKIIIKFKHLGSGLMKKGKELHEFAIAGADMKFVWARATIKNNTVEVHNSDVKHPVAVRYAWADNPQEANLYNEEGLPASPFRTDSW